MLATRSTASYYYYLLLNNVNGNAWLFTIPLNTCRLFPQSARVTRAQEVCECERDSRSRGDERSSSACERDGSGIDSVARSVVALKKSATKRKLTTANAVSLVNVLS